MKLHYKEVQLMCQCSIQDWKSGFVYWAIDMVPVAGGLIMTSNLCIYDSTLGSNDLSCGCKFRLIMLECLDYKVEDEL
jgi:hypothetical protein